MEADEYADLFATYRANFPDRILYIAGFVTGNLGYYSQVIGFLRTKYPALKLPDAVAIHIYTKDPSEAASYIQSYVDQAPGIDPVVTEWNEQDQTGWIVDFQNALANPSTGTGAATLWSSWFPRCTLQRLDGSTPGIVDRDGKSKLQCELLVKTALHGTCPN